MGKSIFHLLVSKKIFILHNLIEQKSIEEKVLINFDAISLFLCICLCTKYCELMGERSVISIDGSFLNLFFLTNFLKILGKRR